MAASLVITMFSIIPGAQAAVSERAMGLERTRVEHDPWVAGPASPASLAAPRSETCRDARRGLAYYESRWAYWRKRMGAGAGRYSRSVRDPSCPHLHSLARLWRSRAHRARARYSVWFHATYAKWECIHRHEGAWTSNTGNGYWGGLQMDWGFMHTYGPEFIRRYGLAHRWPVWAQLIAAERAYFGFAGYGGRGFSPWGTRGMCGV